MQSTTAKSSSTFYVLSLFIQITDLQEFYSQHSYNLYEGTPKL